MEKVEKNVLKTNVQVAEVNGIKSQMSNCVVSVIAIDGPAASGKSTIGQLLAEKLDYLYLDTGCMYRAVTLAALQQGIDVADETAVSQLALQLEMNVLPAGNHEDGRHYTVILSEKDVTWDIRTPEVDKNVSLVSSYQGVREEMVRRQRNFGKRGNVVMVGRDIGTVVMPDAPIKLYMTATAEERARRRWQDRLNQGHQADLTAIVADVIRRDNIDGNRKLSPMRPAEDAVLIDTTKHTVDSILEKILDLVAES